MKLLKTIKIIFLILLILIIAIIMYFSIGKPKIAENIKWGVNFSQKHAEALGLDWKETYLALIDDLGAKEIRIGTHWDILESEEGKYKFDDLDWQIKEAGDRSVNIILVFGMKTPRWPECHIPGWLKDFSEDKRQERVLDLIKETVSRYKDEKSIWAWQVENEPFFPFGECPSFDKDFFKKEIELVKSISSKPIIITESGEMSFWRKAAELGDIVGITMYKKVWSKELNTYLDLFYPPMYYWRKSELIKKSFDKKVICIELQAEPWTPNLIYNSSLEEQKKTMNLEQFKKNVEFARSTGIDTFYFWGPEWWYWMKKANNEPEIWNKAKSLFSVDKLK